MTPSEGKGCANQYPKSLLTLPFVTGLTKGLCHLNNVSLKTQILSSQDRRSKGFLAFVALGYSFLHLHQKHMEQEMPRLTVFGTWWRWTTLVVCIAHISPVTENNLPAQEGGAPSGQRMICGKHFSEGGRANLPVTSLPLRKAGNLRTYVWSHFLCEKEALCNKTGILSSFNKMSIWVFRNTRKISENRRTSKRSSSIQWRQKMRLKITLDMLVPWS